MATDERINSNKVQYYVDIEASKAPPLSSSHIDKYECLTGEEVLRFQQDGIIEQTKLNYSPLWKAFQKQTKNYWRAKGKANKNL